MGVDTNNLHGNAHTHVPENTLKSLKPLKSVNSPTIPQQEIKDTKDTKNQKNLKDDLNTNDAHILKKQEKTQKVRCRCCSKKKCLLKCSCSNMYCVTHIAPGAHQCENILKTNTEIDTNLLIPTGKFEKIHKI